MKNSLLAFAILPLLAAPTLADSAALAPLLVGDDRREDAPPPCLQEPAFLAGVASAATNLQVGGTAYGCDSEWAACLEFALDWLPPGHHVSSARLIVRKTGYADDAQGFFYLGAFSYAADGQPAAVPRDDLDPDTALDVLYPPAANVDLEFDVTAAVQDAVDLERDRVGLLLAGIYSEAGYEDWISIGGAAHPAPPRLEIEYQGAVPASPLSWSSLKAMHHGD